MFKLIRAFACYLFYMHYEKRARFLINRARFFEDRKDILKKAGTNLRYASIAIRKAESLNSGFVNDVEPFYQENLRGLSRDKYFAEEFIHSESREIIQQIKIVDNQLRTSERGSDILRLQAYRRKLETSLGATISPKYQISERQ